MINMSFSNMPAPFLPINYCPMPMRTSIGGYDASRYYLPQTHLSSNIMNPLKQSMIANYLTYFDSLAQNFTSTLLAKGNMDVSSESKDEESNPKDLNSVENEPFCKLEDDNNTKAPKSTKKKQPRLKKLKPKNQVKPEFKKNFWLPAEDALVLDLMKVYGQKWTKISTFLQDRTGKQVRDRYLNHLRPTIDQRDWSDEEDGLLRKLAVELEHRWTVIAAKLDGRTENQVKNRYHALMRRDKREVQQKKSLRKVEPKSKNHNESDDYYEGLVFQPKSESTLTYGSHEDSNKSENEPWDYAFKPLQFHSNIKVENADPFLNSADCHRREEFTGLLGQYKYTGNELIQTSSSNNWTNPQILTKEEEESYSCLPVKKIKFCHNLSFNQINDVKEEFF